MQLDQKKIRMLTALFAGAAAVLLIGALYQQSTQASNEKAETVLIDFNAFPEQDVIEVSRGKTINVPIKVETPEGAQYELKLAVMPDRSSSGLDPTRGSSATVEKTLPDVVTASLDKKSIVLSEADEQRQLGLGRVERTSGALLTISATSTAAEGEYSFILEASRVLPNGDEAVVGKFFTVKVK